MNGATDHDWRLTARFELPEHAHRIFGALKAHASAALAARESTAGLVAEREGEWLRIYGPSLDDLRRAQEIVAAAAANEGVKAEVQAERRDQDADWHDIELPPLAERDAANISEHHGRGPWGAEVESNRVQAHFEMSSRHAAQRFASELAAEGYDVHQAESFLYVFADDAQHAHQLGEELKAKAPDDAELLLEGEGRTIFI